MFFVYQDAMKPSMGGPVNGLLLSCSLNATQAMATYQAWISRNRARCQSPKVPPPVAISESGTLCMKPAVSAIVSGPPRSIQVPKRLQLGARRSKSPATGRTMIGVPHPTWAPAM